MAYWRISLHITHHKQHIQRLFGVHDDGAIQRKHFVVVDLLVQQLFREHLQHVHSLTYVRTVHQLSIDSRTATYFIETTVQRILVHHLHSLRFILLQIRFLHIIAQFLLLHKYIDWITIPTLVLIQNDVIHKPLLTVLATSLFRIVHYSLHIHK